MKRMLDLFSGFHGASQAFQADPSWDVVSIDDNPLLAATFSWDLADDLVCDGIAELGHFDLIWASPPCIEFYKCRAPYFPDYYGKQPDMTLVEQTIRIIQEVEPETWVIENTKAGAHYMEPYLGRPRSIFGPFYLWGSYPKFEADVPKDIKTRQDKRWSPLRSNHKAKVPASISRGLHDVLERQVTLF